MNPITNPVLEPYVERDFVGSFFLSFFTSFLLMIFAELGDKTFVMLIILQMRTNKITIFAAALFVEILMNVLAIMLGALIDHLLYKNLIDYCGIVFFFLYGAFLLGDSLKTKDESFETELTKAENFHKREEDYNSRTTKTSGGISEKLTVIPEMTFEENLVSSKSVKATKSKDKKACEAKENSLKKCDKARFCDEDKEDLLPQEQSENYNYNLVPVSPKKDENKNIKEDDSLNVDVFWVIVKTMALSEFGDRSQVIGMSMSSIFDYRGVLCGSCLALFITCVLGVYYGKTMIKVLNEKLLCFLLGLLMLYDSLEIYLRKKEHWLVKYMFM